MVYPSFTFPTSSVPGTTFTWSHAATVSNPAKSGTGTINDTLHNMDPFTIMTTYDFTLTAAGCSNQQIVNVLVRFCPDGVEELYTQQALIYPNPTQGTFSVTIPSEIVEETQILIFNLTGEKVYDASAQTNKNCMVCLNATPGVYIVKATTSLNTYQTRILVR